MNRLILALIFSILSGGSFSAVPIQNKVRDYRIANEHRILEEFVTLLSIPNVASDRDNIRKNAGLILEMMKRRDLHPRLLEAKDPNAPPVVYGEWKAKGMARTIILYAHYDGQPTDPQQWTGSQPWQPVLRRQRWRPAGKSSQCQRKVNRSIRNGVFMLARRRMTKQV